MIFKDQHVLITGGTGSLGKTLCKRILSGDRGSPSSVTVLSRDEAKQEFMRRQFAPDLNRLRFRIGDVRRYDDVLGAMRGMDIVINAAALKQVPSCEYAPEQALLTNCVGPINIVRAWQNLQGHAPHTVVGVSTDKACEPVNTMGITKALQERIFVSANLEVGKRTQDARFVCVRYGNVLASRGSVVPLFKEQIAQGGPVTITVSTMTRFLLSLSQAADTIFAAIRSAGPGDIYVPRVPAAKMMDVAVALIGDLPIAIEMMGIRPGEKIHECLVSDSERYRTRETSGYFVVTPGIPELAWANGHIGIGRPYMSCDDVMALSQVKDLLSLHGLIGTPMAQEGELLA